MLSGQNLLLAQIKPLVHHAAPAQEKERFWTVCSGLCRQTVCLLGCWRRRWNRKRQVLAAPKHRWLSSLTLFCLFWVKRHFVNRRLGKCQNKDRLCFACDSALVWVTTRVWHRWACTAREQDGWEISDQQLRLNLYARVGIYCGVLPGMSPGHILNTGEKTSRQAGRELWCIWIANRLGGTVIVGSAWEDSCPTAQAYQGRAFLGCSPPDNKTILR